MSCSSSRPPCCIRSMYSWSEPHKLCTGLARACLAHAGLAFQAACLLVWPHPDSC